MAKGDVGDLDSRAIVAGMVFSTAVVCLGIVLGAGAGAGRAAAA